MPDKTWRVVAVAAACLCSAASSATAEQPRRAPVSDHASSTKAHRVSSPRTTESVLNTPGHTTVLTREVLDDMKATSVRDALRSTAGVTIGR